MCPWPDCTQPGKCGVPHDGQSISVPPSALHDTQRIEVEFTLVENVRDAIEGERPATGAGSLGIMCTRRLRHVTRRDVSDVMSRRESIGKEALERQAAERPAEPL